MNNKEENESPSFWTNVITALILAVILTLIVSPLLTIVPWVPPDWHIPTLTLVGIAFFVGFGIYIMTKNTQFSSYSFILGIIIEIGSLAIATILALYATPVPIIGNALSATALVVAIIIGIVFVWLRSTKQDVVTTNPIATSSKSLTEQKQSIQRLFMQKKTEIVLALELVEEPHDYIFSENEERSPSTHIERFSDIVRSLFSTPYSICYQQHNSKTRFFFTSWSNDVIQISHQRTVLLDAIQYSLPKFKFRVLETFTGIDLKEHEKGSAAIITGVPLSVDDESQREDSLENIVGVLRGLENGIFQVFVEPVKMSKPNLKKLEDQYKSEVMRSETVISKERSGLLHKDQQESRTSVNMDAKKKAEILDRKIKRLSESNLYQTTVTALAWGPDIDKADMDARRMAIALVGSLRPDTDREPFQVDYKTKRKDIVRLMRGLPVGKSTILTAGEVTNYCKLTRRDIGLSITKREKFSSGVKETEAPVESEDVQEEKVASLVPTKVEVIKRSPTLFLGHPIDESGKVQPKSYITCAIKFLKMHLAVLGYTQSGKSTTLRSIFGQLITLGVIPIMFLPSKIHEALRLLLLSEDIRICTCDRTKFYSLLFNCWDPPKNVRLSKWVGRVVHAWSLWLPNDPVISMHFEKVVYTMYERCGWDIKRNKKGRPILITDLIEALEEEQEKLQYGEEVSSNISGALVERIKLILRQYDLVNIINTKIGITVEELLAHPTIIDMEPLFKPEKTLLMGLLTAAICEYKLANPTEELTNSLILDEAHYLLGRVNVNGEAHSGAQLQAIDAFVEMLRVVGGTGLGVIIADQSPTSLVPEVLKIIVNMIVHGLPDDDDRKLVGSHTRCTESQVDHIGGMQPGEAVVYLQHEGTPKNVMIFPLDRFVVGGLPKGPVIEEIVEEHMNRIIDNSPNLADRVSEIEVIDIEPEPSEEMTETDSDEVELLERLLAKFPKELQNRIKAAVNHPTSKKFCEEHLEKEDVNILTSLIHKISEKSGDGSFHSHLVVFNYLYQEYGCEENHHVFERIGSVLDGEVS